MTRQESSSYKLDLLLVVLHADRGDKGYSKTPSKGFPFSVFVLGDYSVGLFKIPVEIFLGIS